MNLNYRLVFLAVILSLFGSQLTAQKSKESKAVANWYFKEAFMAVDRNRDDNLTIAEFSAFSSEFSWFLDQDNFNRANRNNDKGISLEELTSYAKLAVAHRVEKDSWELKALHQKYPYFGSAKAKYFKRQPELAEQLLTNLVWTRENPKIVEKLISDRNWLRENPKIIRALHQNLTWLAEHPDAAQKFYSQKETQSLEPEFKRWRNSHLALLKKNGQLKTKTFRIEEEKEVNSNPITSKNKFDEDLPVLKLRDDVPTSSSQPSGDSEAEKLRAQLAKVQEELNENIKERMMEQQRAKVAMDSLTQANLQFEKENKSLNKELYVLKDSLNKDLEKITMKDSESLNTIDELKKQVRYMKIEKQLARIEEDSLLAKTIRQEKNLKNLNEKLEKLESLEDENTISVNEAQQKKLIAQKDSLIDEVYQFRKRTNQLETDLKDAMAEIESVKSSASNDNSDSLFNVNRALNRRYQELYVDYQIALDEKESLIKAISQNSEESESKIEELTLSQGKKDENLQRKLISLENQNRNYKIQLDSISSIQSDKEWQITSLKEEKDQLIRKVESLESSEGEMVNLTPKAKEEKELLQENIRLESQLAKIERERKGRESPQGG